MDICIDKEIDPPDYNFTCDTEAPPSQYDNGFICTSKDQNDNQKRKVSGCDSPVQTSSPKRYSDEDNSGNSFSSLGPSQKHFKVDGIQCSLCQSVPVKSPLYGCKESHYICEQCREHGGVLLSCPVCLNPEISFRLQHIEDILFTKDCSFAATGCHLKISDEAREEHEDDCDYRLVSCPKKLFAKSCTFSDSYLNIREHARNIHGFNKGYTLLDDGFITSKMMDKKDKPNLENIYSASARFPPLEMDYKKKLFYTYYERENSRSIWIFFIRIYGSPETAAKYRCEMYIGPGNLDKNDQDEAERVFRGNVVPYKLSRKEIHESGSCFVIDDAAMRSFRRDSILFRMWWRILPRESGH